MSFFAMPSKSVAKKPIQGKRQAVKPAQKNVVQKKPVPGKTKGLPLLKETPQASFVQNKPAPKPAPDKVENLAKEYLAELKEVDVTSARLRVRSQSGYFVFWTSDLEGEQPSSRNIAPNIRNSPATSERSFLESAA